MNPITITVPQAKWIALAHDIHRGCHVLKLLREAGVPVVGNVWPSTVVYGALEHRVVGTDLVWTWNPAL